MDGKLYRSNNDKMVAGVCGGVAKYFSIDSTIVRIIVVLFALSSLSITLILYIIAAIIIPEKQSDIVEIEELDEEGNVKKGINLEDGSVKKFIGIVLIGFGGVVLFSRLFDWVDSGIVFSIGIIVVGGILLFKNK